ncbi:hypothetical protein CWR40_002491 [Cronobacter sakazakii]|uniref:hypothetical protein n=2 Tax=Cronobacter sakazakii TaxID=28141 RepID=UPI0004907979|nr:hypothetical protein [Cronobacter sakazakii]AKE96466.1 hypothetical protein CSK29544_03519 [Cronobacter sakazakii]AXW97948.2 hypothetical protein CsakCS931_28050 [Cronobacter sakazakii]EGT4285721.1 hypothetical protein [Cronobacter sakazakii]EGT4294856.1 hypothetical protein [Cronobacter sakazakii]EIZ2432511.1 hypothetical protein [Cronobacter sakazakii]
MTEETILYAVVAHHSRMNTAHQLAASLNAYLIIDECDNGANWNHRRALGWAAGQNRPVVVLEDDALPVDGFEILVSEWLIRFPDSLISFYLGTGRPPQYQLEIATKLIAADRERADYITMQRLVHAVCYSVPPKLIPKVLARWDASKPADYAVGDACGGPVIYPCNSLVDHADGLPVEKHPDRQPRRERRRAWRLHG